LTPLGVVARQRRCRATTLDDRRNKGLRYPADPPTVQEIIAVMREAGTDRHRARLRALIVVLWRGGLLVHHYRSLRTSPSLSRARRHRRD